MPQEPDRCPLCQQPNRCAVAAGASGEIHCWCMDQSFAQTLSPERAALPGSTGTACVCQTCVQRAKAG